MKRTLLLLTIVFLFACGQQQNQGVQITQPIKDPMHKVQGATGFTDANGIRQGFWTITNDSLHLPGYQDNDKVMEGSYKDGKKEGLWIEYQPGGTIKDKLTYKDDSIVSKQ